MNTALSGSGWVHDIKSHLQGEIRGLTKLVKITEDVRKFAAQKKSLRKKLFRLASNKKLPNSPKLAKFIKKCDARADYARAQLIFCQASKG